MHNVVKFPPFFPFPAIEFVLSRQHLGPWIIRLQMQKIKSGTVKSLHCTVSKIQRALKSPSYPPCQGGASRGTNLQNEIRETLFFGLASTAFFIISPPYLLERSCFSGCSSALTQRAVSKLEILKRVPEWSSCTICFGQSMAAMQRWYEG